MASWWEVVIMPAASSISLSGSSQFPLISKCNRLCRSWPWPIVECLPDFHHSKLLENEKWSVSFSTPTPPNQIMELPRARGFGAKHPNATWATRFALLRSGLWESCTGLPFLATKIPAKGVIEATKVAWKAWGNVGQDLHKKLQKMFFSFLRLSSCWGRCRYCCNCCSGRCRRVAPPFFCCSTSDVMATWRGAEKAAPRSTHRFDFSSNFECLGYDGKEIEKRQLRVATLSWC